MSYRSRSGWERRTRNSRSFVGMNRECRVGDFFKGWRRKAGLGTLAMACLLAVALMRSRVYSDFITCYRSDRTNHFLASFQDGIKWIASSSGPAVEQTIPPRLSSSRHFVAESDDALQPIFAGVISEWRWQWRGFGFVCGEAEVCGYDVHVWQVPYLSLILPLTLFSAWLILGKPRKASRQLPTSDPRS